MPFVAVPVPGAQPEPAPIAGAQLVVPKGAGVAPGVLFVRVVVPGMGVVATPVMPVGEFTTGVVGYGTGPPGAVVVPGVVAGVVAPGVPPAGAAPAVPVVPAAKAAVPAQIAMKQPVVSRRAMRRIVDICFMSALPCSRSGSPCAPQFSLREREARPRVASNARRAPEGARSMG